MGVGPVEAIVILASLLIIFAADPVGGVHPTSTS